MVELKESEYQDRFGLRGRVKNGLPFNPNKLTLTGLLLASTMMMMGGAVVAPSLPMISAVFPQTSEFVISLIITLPSLAIAITGMGVGALADKFGKVRVLVVSLLIFGIAGVSGYFLSDIATILIGRFFVGVGIAGLTCSSTALLSEYYSGAARIKVLSYQAAANGVGALVLQLSGGVLAGISWRLPFLIYGLGFIIMMVVLVSAREPAHSRTSNDLGAARGKRINWALVALSYVSIFLTMFLMFALVTKLAYYMSDLGGSTALCGLFLGFNGVGTAITSMLYRKLSARYGALTMLTAAFGLFAVAYLLFALPASYFITFISVCLVGIATGFAMPTVTNTLARESTSVTSGRIMGGFSVMFYLGEFMSSVILIPILTVAGSYGNMYVYLGCTSVLIFVIFVAMAVHSRSMEIAQWHRK